MESHTDMFLKVPLDAPVMVSFMTFEIVSYQGSHVSGPSSFRPDVHTFLAEVSAFLVVAVNDWELITCCSYFIGVDLNRNCPDQKP